MNAPDVSLTFAALCALLYNWKRYGGSWKAATWLTLPRNRQSSPLTASGEGKFSSTALILGREHDGTTDADVGSAAETSYFFGCFRVDCYFCATKTRLGSLKFLLVRHGAQTTSSFGSVSSCAPSSLFPLCSSSSSLSHSLILCQLFFLLRRPPHSDPSFSAVVQGLGAPGMSPLTSLCIPCILTPGLP